MKILSPNYDMIVEEDDNFSLTMSHFNSQQVDLNNRPLSWGAIKNADKLM